jgi:oligopeptide/dipeptide ABC transporter ATP-binding protein
MIWRKGVAAEQICHLAGRPVKARRGMKPLLAVKNLTTSFRSEDGSTIRAVDDVSFEVKKGKTLAIVGESGCGKSVTALSIMRLIPTDNGCIDSGNIDLEGRDLLKLDSESMRKVRGNDISMIFQEPMTALNPVYTVGQQIAEVFRIHRQHSRKLCREEAIRMLDIVKMPDPERRVDEYPFQLSGGMRQRVMIAMALACEPKLLIADEPTTALDVTIQWQIIKLMKDLQRDRDTSIIFITHDLGVVANVADDVAIMYAGKVVEQGSVFEVFEKPQHPYTQALLRAIPQLDADRHNRLATIEGTVPGLKNLPSGCRFHTRCQFTQGLCKSEIPLLNLRDGQGAACHKVAGMLS